MAIGPLARDALRKLVHEQYKEQSIPATLSGLDLALRGFELSRKRLDNTALTWEEYVPLRGHYNATASGILDALNDKGLTPKAAQIWKNTHARHWTELEEPAFMTQYCQALFQQLVPHIVATHSSLRALNNMFVSLKNKGDDPKSAAVIRSSIEANTVGMNKAGFGIEVRALRGIYGFDQNTDFAWMTKYLPKLNAPTAVVETPAVTPAASMPPRKKGLQKCTPSDMDDFPMDAPEPVGEPWEEALGTHPGGVASPKVSTPTPEVPKRPKGLQKCTPTSDPDAITDDSFGM